VNPEQFFTASGVIIVAGKGGVGKTAVTAAMAVAASSVGLRTLIVEVEGKNGLPSMFGAHQLSYDEIELVPADGCGGVVARTITPDDALLDYLRDHGLQRISNRLMASGALDMVSTAVPGIRDILVLGKVKQVEQSAQFDLILLDAPAAGHAVTFLKSAAGLADAVRVGPISTQARDVLELLNDPTRCRVVLVTIPEETPVSELIQTAYGLEDEVGVALGPVVVNGVFPPLPGLATDPSVAADETGAQLLDNEGESMRRAADFRTARTALQEAQLERMAEELPLAQFRLPYLFVPELTRSGIDALAGSLLEGIRAEETPAGAGPEAGA
jgi:anion-transporting  ArsA/GET3 family ATPase